jgi:hypothetical protein
MTTQESQPTEILFDKGTLFDLFVGKPTFQKKLRSNDVLLEGSINDDAIYLGHKKLLPKEAMGRLVTLEGLARTALAGRSLEFPLSGARFVYFRALPDLLVRLRSLQRDWNSAVQDLVDNYPELKARQLSILDSQSEDLMMRELAKGPGTPVSSQRAERQKELEEWLEMQKLQHRKLYPPVDELPQMFRFTWRMFKVSAVEGLEELNTLQQDELLAAREALRADLQSWVRTATSDMHRALGEAAAQAKNMLEKQGKLNPKNLRPLFEAFETFNAIDFTGSSDWRKQVDDARERFIRRNADGSINFELTSESINGTSFATTEFKNLLNSIGSLALEQTAEEAGRVALAKTKGFARFLEV